MPERPVFSFDVAKPGGGGPAAVKPEAVVAAMQPAREQLPAKPIPAAIKSAPKVAPPLPAGATKAPILEAPPALVAVAQQTSKAAAPTLAGPAPAAESPPGAAPAAAPIDPKTQESDLRPEPTLEPTAHASEKTDEEAMMGAAPSQAKTKGEEFTSDEEDRILADLLQRVKRKRQAQVDNQQDQAPGGR